MSCDNRIDVCRWREAADLRADDRCTFRRKTVFRARESVKKVGSFYPGWWHPGVSNRAEHRPPRWRTGRSDRATANLWRE
jgi:hypothetical protein